MIQGEGTLGAFVSSQAAYGAVMDLKLAVDNDVILGMLLAFFFSQ